MPGTYNGSGGAWIFATDGQAIHLRSDQGADKAIIDCCSFINGVIFPTDVKSDDVIDVNDLLQLRADFGAACP